ncbi:MAG: hypothetical protein JRG89_14430 [Deltaproteobacteria bacterium]|nr:hypothetical protein [Deltaproteobacteria bacterium]MBW2389613.1 hypothetical protein [Deltaproteobacteria bacterium]
MFPDPLHPALVHFPIVLAVLAPFLAAAAAWAIYSGRLSGRSWVGIVILQVLVAGTAWIATETGENEEDRVERVVSERYIEEHEEAAERFLVLAALVVPLAAAGMLTGGVGAINRVLTIVLSLVALAAAGSAGHSGGELVYRHGAAMAYTQTGSGETAMLPTDTEYHLAYDDDDDTDD